MHGRINKSECEQSVCEKCGEMGMRNKRDVKKEEGSSHPSVLVQSHYLVGMVPNKLGTKPLNRALGPSVLTTCLAGVKWRQTNGFHTHTHKKYLEQ